MNFNAYDDDEYLDDDVYDGIDDDEDRNNWHDEYHQYDDWHDRYRVPNDDDSYD